MYKRDEEKIRLRLESDYNYLTSLGYEVVAVVLQGSQNYDLDYEDSDIDTKAIVLPKFKDLILGKTPVSTTLVLESDEHIDVKDIRPMFDNFLKQNINFLEFLFSKYSYINPLYAEAMKTLTDNKEKIAHYDNYRAVNCIVGMMYQKHKALEHPYPATKHKIEKYGYDGKQLHHIIRCCDFLDRYVKGESFEECLIANSPEKLISIKQNKEFGLEKAREIAQNFIRHGDSIKVKFIEESHHIVDKEVEELLENIILTVLSKYCAKYFEEFKS